MIHVGTPTADAEWSPCAFGNFPPVATSRSKRAFDVTVASLTLLVMLPLLVLIAVAIVLESKGPAFFKQERSGLGGKRFDILKFRTMHVQPPEATVDQAIVGDSRVTAIGRVLRRLSLDELPQLINVVRGEMSLIGPRPHAINHDMLWCEAVPEYMDRFRARPGLSGLAQARGYRGEIRTLNCIIKRVQSDNEYVERWSLSLDIEIIVVTLKKMFRDPSAY